MSQPTVLWRYILWSKGNINANPSSRSFVMEYRRTSTNIIVELKSKHRPKKQDNDVEIFVTGNIDIKIEDT